MRSSINFGKFVLVVSLFNTDVQAFEYADHLKIRHEILSIVPDCRIAKDQITWLQSVKPTMAERSDARNNLFFFGGFSPNFWRNRDVAEGTIDWAVNDKIREISNQCRS